MVSRREWLRITAGAGAALGLNPRVLEALQSQEIITRAIPSTGERLPAVGLGGANTFSRVARAEDFDAVRGVLRALVDGGGSVFDTAAGYGASEEVSGRVADELRIADRIFWATKVNVAGRGGRPADRAAARAQVERSFERLRIPVIDLIQVHNLGDPPTQLGILEELKATGRIRYIGITTTNGRQYPALADVMRNEPIDFIGIDYAVDNRIAEEVILPLAQERQIGVIVYPAVRTEPDVAADRRPPATGLGGRVRRAHLGAVHAQVRSRPPSGHRGDPGHQRPGAHGGQPRRRERAAPQRAATPSG